jgi:hypothetical protein
MNPSLYLECLCAGANRCLLPWNLDSYPYDDHERIWWQEWLSKQTIRAACSAKTEGKL